MGRKGGCRKKRTKFANKYKKCIKNNLNLACIASQNTRQTVVIQFLQLNILKGK